MRRRLMWVLWPGFLMAIPAVGVVFTLVDPAELRFIGPAMELSPLGAYTVGFLFFWALGSSCSAITTLLQRPPVHGSADVSVADRT